MKLLDKKTSGDLVRLLVFIVTTSLATSLLVILIGNLSFQDEREYKAEFLDVTGMVEGDDVRIAGVKVGSVKNIEVDTVEVTNETTGSTEEQKRAIVTFSVAENTNLTESTFANIRYRNLVGQRYIALTQGVGSTDVMSAGETIPEERTDEALDLTVLFNGFKPLFEALSPDDLNKLSFELVQVFQGEAGTVEGLLQSTASVTKTLADRDAIIGELIDNLDFVLDHLADRDQQLTRLITSFRTLVTGLNDDRDAILDSLDQISALSVTTADLAKGIRPPLVEDIKQLRRFAKNTDDNKAELDRALQVMPIKLRKVGRTAIYGSWFNFYLCEFKGRIRLGDALTLPINYPPVGQISPRCDLGG